MKKVQLGRSDLFVTSVCLGTMTFGEQNTQAEEVLEAVDAVRWDIRDPAL